MLRELQTNGLKTVDAMYRADVDMATGMAVVKNRVDKTADMPNADTVSGIYFTMKERIPIGLNCAKTDMSDYDEDFTKIKKNEMVKLITPENGERYGTDQYVATGLTKGCAVMVGTDGKFVKATKESTIIFDGEYDDAGHTLAIIEFTNNAVTNA